MTSAAIVIALVAAIRKQVPAIDGAWVYLLALSCALVVSGYQTLPDWQAWLRLAIPAWVAACGGMTALQALADRASSFAPSEAPTSAETPEAKR